MPTRRDILKLTMAGAGAAAGFLLEGPAFSAALGLAGGVFQYGVASGDPLPDRVVIWTRVTPDPGATPGSGKGAPTAVRWRVSRRRDLADPVASGTFTTDPASDHTVKIDVPGLSPGTTYHYGFTVGTEASPVGHTRTAPAAGASPSRLRFGFVSCSNYAAGWFVPYRYLASRCDLDFVLHVGDYTYEYGDGQYGGVRPLDPPGETTTLEHYRRRQALYKADPDLAALHANVPWITTIDDHEVADNAWRDGAGNHDPATEGVFRTRRNAGYQAYREWMPIRPATTPTEDETRWYRRFTWGTLADLAMLDLRQYRDQPGTPTDPTLATKTMVGPAQQSWLLDHLAATTPRWRLVGNSVQFMQVLYPNVGGSVGFAALTPQTALNTDAWDGYPGTRAAVQGAIEAHAADYDAVFLTGDIHSSWAAELPTFAAPPVAPGYTSRAVELVCPSVTSDGFGEILPPGLLAAGLALVTGSNPHVKYLEGTRHGCCVVDVTAARVQCDWYFTTSTAADVRTDPAATMQPGASWRTRAGSKRLEPVSADGTPAPVIDDCATATEPEPPTSTSTSAPATTAGPTSSGTTDSSGTGGSDTSVLLPVGGVAVVAAGIAGAALALRRRRA